MNFRKLFDSDLITSLLAVFGYVVTMSFVEAVVRIMIGLATFVLICIKIRKSLK